MSDLVTAPTVIAIDPGGTTGWDIMQVHPEALVDRDVPVLMNIEFHEWGQIPTRGIEEGEEACADLITEMALNWPGACLLIESFYIRQMSVDLSPVRITAMIKSNLYQAAKEGPHFLVIDEQQPAMAKTTAPNAQLEKWGLLNQTVGQDHARDASRHSITWFRRALQDAPMRGEVWPHIYRPNGTLIPDA